MEVEPCGSYVLWKESLSVLREWKKPYVKTSMFRDIHMKHIFSQFFFSY